MSSEKFEITFKIVGARIREIRDAKNIKQKDVCETINVAKVTVSRIEAGIGASMDVFFSYLNYLKAVHNISIPDLFEEKWSINEVISNDKSIQDLTWAESIENNKKLSSYSMQIKNILMVQRDKSYQEYNDLIDLTSKIERIHSS